MLLPLFRSYLWGNSAGVHSFPLLPMPRPPTPQWGVFAGFASLEHADFGSFRGRKQQLMVRCNQGL